MIRKVDVSVVKPRTGARRIKTRCCTLAAENRAPGHVAVGSVWALPPALALQYHLFRHERFSRCLGAGINATFFYGAKAPSAPVTSLSVDPCLSVDHGTGAAVQAGFDYNFSGHWFDNFDVKQIFLNTTANASTVLGPIKARTDLIPLVAGAGIGYRF